MATADRIYWLHVLTPLHIGAGKGEGYIDLPLMREKLTNFPFVPGSSVKGVFRDSCETVHAARAAARPKVSKKEVDETAQQATQAAGSNIPVTTADGSLQATAASSTVSEQDDESDEVLRAAFGQAGDDTANAGAIVFTDARLVCLPVRSLFGTFAWCTSPLVLQRLTRDWKAAGLECGPILNAKDFDKSKSMTLIPDSSTEKSALLNGGTKIYLEDLDLDVDQSSKATAWAKLLSEQLFPDHADEWQLLFRQRFAILSDEAFSFLAETGTDVQPHIRIDPDFKRVADGALWYEESLPAESILCGLVWCDPPRAMHGLRPKIEALLESRCVQMGGKATTGKGRVKLLFPANRPLQGGISK